MSLSLLVSLSLSLFLSVSVSLPQVSSASSDVLLRSTAYSMLAIFSGDNKALVLQSPIWLRGRWAPDCWHTKALWCPTHRGNDHWSFSSSISAQSDWWASWKEWFWLYRDATCYVPFLHALGWRNCYQLKYVVCISSTVCTENNYSQQCVLMICFITWKNALTVVGFMCVLNIFKYCIDLWANKSLIILKTKYCQCVAKLLIQCLIGLCFFLSRVTRCNRKMKV